MRDMTIVRRACAALAVTLTAAAVAPAAEARFFDINSHGTMVLLAPWPQKQLHFDAWHHVALAPMPEAGLRE
jgi:hypothetical protein